MANSNENKNPFEGMTFGKMKTKWGEMSPSQRKANKDNFINAATKTPTNKVNSTKPNPKNNTKYKPTGARAGSPAGKAADTTTKARSTSNALKTDYNMSRSRQIAKAMAKSANKNSTKKPSTKKPNIRARTPHLRDPWRR